MVSSIEILIIKFPTNYSLYKSYIYMCVCVREREREGERYSERVTECVNRIWHCINIKD